MSAQVSYAIEISVDAVERPEGWVSISISARYSYRAGVRGMFEATDEKGIAGFIASGVPTIMAMERMNAEAEAAEAAAEKAATVTEAPAAE
jgi:hypothetical protein